MLIEGVFDKSQKQAMIGKVTDAMVEIEGEAMRGVTWVRVTRSPVGMGHRRQSFDRCRPEGPPSPRYVTAHQTVRPEEGVWTSPLCSNQGLS